MEDKDRDRGRGRVEYFRLVGELFREGVRLFESSRDSLLTRLRLYESSTISSNGCEGDRWRGAERNIYSIGIGLGEAWNMGILEGVISRRAIQEDRCC